MKVITNKGESQYDGAENFQELWDFCCQTFQGFGLDEADHIISVLRDSTEVDLSAW